MIQQFGIEDFKSYRRATLPLAPLTVLIGANASGKSNAIEALQFLSWLARGRRLGDVFQAIQDHELSFRGTFLEVTHKNADGFALECVLSGDRPWHRLRIRVGVTREGMRIQEESIEGAGAGLPLYRIEARLDEYGHDVAVSYNNFARGGKKPRITCTDQQAVFTQLQTPSRFAKGHLKSQKVIPETVERFRRALEGILFLDPDPSAMRDYSFIVDRVLQRNGANISSVLHNLCVAQEKKDQVLEFVRSLPEQDIVDIAFWEGPRNDVMFRLTETFGGERQEWDASALSDGTLRVLAVAAAVLSTPEDSLVVIEEVDNGVHPSRAELLLGRIHQQAVQRRLKVLLTTHNPALLNALPLEAVPDVVCCYRDPREGDSRLVRLADLPDYPELVAQGPLGSLMTQGVLERFLKSRTSPEEKKDRALRWLDSLRVAEGKP